VIEFLLFQGRLVDEIAVRLHNVYGEAVYTRLTVFRYYIDHANLHTTQMTQYFFTDYMAPSCLFVIP
jgi:hypothetical protein